MIDVKFCFFYLMCACFLFTSCQGQTSKNKESKSVVISHGIDGNPKIDIRVNKRYDKKGNLITFDSTYSSYYSNRINEKKLMDSLFRDFKPFISEEFPLFKDKRFDKLFFTDSLVYEDFFHDDFFRKRYELNGEYLKNMMHHMDSIKNEYFRKKSNRIKKG